ncbi:MAG: ABC transporter permease [Eubacteriales bacterium]
MKQIMTVFGFTFREAVKKKAFIISTILILVIVLVLCSLPQLISAFSEKSTSDVKGNTCYYVDDARLVDCAAAALAAKYTDTEIVPGESSKIEEYKAEIKENSKKSMIVITEAGGAPLITLTTKTFMSSMDAKSVSELLSPLYISKTLEARGIDGQTIAFSQSEIPYQAQIAGSMDASGYGLGILLLMIMYFSIYYYGYGVSMSVATEKTTRVMETLIVSAKPSHILIGKCLAMGSLGLMQFSMFLGVGVIGYKLMIPADFTLMGMPLSLSAFTLQSGLLILVYFILGYSLYALMNAVCGALVNKIEDLNSAMLPVMFISMISFYAGYIAALTDTSVVFQRITMYLPFSSPFIVPFKLLNSDISAMDVGTSISALIAAVAVVGMISIKIYTASVLHYGKKMKLFDLYKSKI